MVITCYMSCCQTRHLFFFFVGFEYAITQLKSVVLSLGIIDRHLSVEQAVLLSRLEEEYQVGEGNFFFFCN